MTSDSEGYTCIMMLHLSKWVIVDRYRRVVEGEPPHDDYSTARQRADEMNDDVIARRLADIIAKR